MDTRSYQSYDATGLADLLNKREVHATELVDAANKRIEETASLHAVVARREKEAWQEAKAFDDQRTPFAGVPFLLKDASHALKGAPLTSGSALFRHQLAEATNHYTARLQKAGFTMLGHTNAPEFGLKNITEPKLHGPCRNPWNPAYSPGGSSGGAAAAVASGVVPVAGASDGGGSIRIPASFTGLFGLKPTRGRTPVGPGVGRQWQGAAIDFALSKSVRDSAALLDVLQVIQPAAAFQTPLFEGSYVDASREPLAKGLRIAFSVESPVGTPVSDEAKEAVRKLARWLEEQGHNVEEKRPNIDGVALMRQYYLMNSGEMASLLEKLEEGLGHKLSADDFETESWVLAQAGKKVSAATYARSLSAWDAAAAKMSAFHERYDFYITPATASGAPEVGELTPNAEVEASLKEVVETVSATEQQELIYEMFLPSLSYTPFTQLANLTGQPAMSMPLHLTQAGMPLGVHVMAQKGEEHRLLQLAHACEESDFWQPLPFF
ncbi:amidase [Shouchella shacheensis]|uniref:amidase n=1 Tax=Shouchella shacheensis TaxID=1649580 RepID=UPI00073FCFF5|nr:amidase [Shouchella shacheensis]